MADDPIDVSGTETLPRVAAVRPTPTSADRQLYVRLVYSESLPPSAPQVDAVYELAPERPLFVGRAPGAGRILGIASDGWMSRRHASLTATTPPRAPGVVVEDLGSRNGTFVRGQRITRPTVARIGDVVQIGSTLFVAGYADPPDDDAVGPPADFICRSPAMRGAWARVLRLAESDSSALILGEMGTGKTRIAQLIHEHSARAGRPFLPHNCSAIPINLEEATLFGIVGGFIPSVKAQDGLLTRARGGTLFLDELADMPPLAQAKLLDAFDSRNPSYMPVGGTRRLETDCRLISATNRDVFQLASSGELRHDLLSRLVVGQLTVPPLRERREDLLPIFYGALARAGVDDPAGAVHSAEVAAALLTAHWVENVRGLETLARRVALGEALTPDLVQKHADRGLRPVATPPPSVDLPVAESPPPDALVWPPNQKELLTLLAEHDFRINEAAEAIGRRRETLSRLVRTVFGPGGKASAQAAYRIWKTTGRVPEDPETIDTLSALFTGPETDANRAARSAWRQRGELPG